MLRHAQTAQDMNPDQIVEREAPAVLRPLDYGLEESGSTLGLVLLSAYPSRYRRGGDPRGAGGLGERVTAQVPRVLTAVQNQGICASRHGDHEDSFNLASVLVLTRPTFGR